VGGIANPPTQIQRCAAAHGGYAAMIAFTGSLQSEI
jgi:hypothetical protein